MIYLLVSVNVTVFALTHLPEAQDNLYWIQTSENYERIC
jgi:hypothetical protein